MTKFSLSKDYITFPYLNNVTEKTLDERKKICLDLLKDVKLIK